MDWYQWLILFIFSPLLIGIALLVWQLPSMFIYAFVMDRHLDPFEDKVLYWGALCWIPIFIVKMKKRKEKKAKEKAMSNSILGGILGSSPLSSGISYGNPANQAQGYQGLASQLGATQQSYGWVTSTSNIPTSISVAKETLKLSFGDGFYDINGICIRNLEDIEAFDFNSFQVLIKGAWLQLNINNWMYHKDEYKKDILKFISQMEHAKKIGNKFDEIIEG